MVLIELQDAGALPAGRLNVRAFLLLACTYLSRPPLWAGIRRSAVLPLAWLCASAGAQTGAFEAEARPIEVGESASGSVSLAGWRGSDLTNNGCDMSGRVRLSFEGFGDRKYDNDYYRLEIPRVENTSDGHAWCRAYVRLTEQSDPESTGFNIVKFAALAPGADGGTVNGTAGGSHGESSHCYLVEPGEYCAEIVIAGGSVCRSRHSDCDSLSGSGFHNPPPGQYYVHVFTADVSDNPRYYDLVTFDGTLEVPGSSAFMEGRWSYRVSGDEVSIEIERIVNATDRTTGPLNLTLWLTTDRDPYSQGYVAARHQFTSGGGRLGPGESFDDVRLTMDFVRPAQPGNYYFHVFTSQHPDPDKILHVRTSSSSHYVSGGRTQSDDDHGDSRSDATRVSLPSRTTGEIDPGDDEDYFRFEVSRRGEVLARTTGGLDAEGILYDSSGSEIARNSDGGEGNNFRIRRELEAGTYYVRVSSWRNDTGAYTLHLSIETGSDGSPDLAVSSLSADRREVDPGERFTLSATVRNRGDARSDATTIRYYRTAGNRDTLLGTNSIRALAPSGTASDDFRARAETAPGTYAYRACVAEVSGESNTANNCGSPVEVRVRRSSGGGDDHGDSRSDATRVSLPSQTSGEIDPGDDEDYFRFDVSARGEVLARTTGGVDTLGALYDADGAAVATDDDGGAGTNFRIQRQLDAGAYYVRVSSWRAGTGAYALHLSFESASGGGDGGGSSSGGNSGGLENGGYRRTLGDFDGDGRDDVLLRHEDGRWFFYPMNGRRHMAGRGTVNLTRNLEWSVAGVGDFNGDGKDDVLLRKAATTGTWYYYPMNGRRHLSGHGAANLPRDLSWSVAGIGDFDKNGRDDVLLRHEDGRWHFYPMNGRRTAAGQGTANLTRNLEWSVAGVGDFDGDGKDDVLLRKPTTGTWYYYPMNGRRHLSGRGAANLPSDLSWSVAGIGDFDGNGKDDVLLRHQDGRWHFHPMNGRHAAAGAGRAALTGNLEWSVAGVGDLNGDGKDDVLLRKPATGAWYYYPMNGRRHLPERGGANLTSNRAWGGLFPIDGTGGGANGAPKVATAIANRSLATGGDATLDLSGHFSDDQALVYEVRSSDAEVLRVSVTGGVLTLMPVAEGSATVTVTARDPDGNEATQTFSVTVGPSGGGGGGGEAGETFRDCDACPEMVVVPAGRFMMGAPESEALSWDDERPVHEVTVSSFAVGVYEVTFDEWDACVADGGCGGYQPSAEGWGKGRRPVIDVSWDDAQRYVEWLSSRTGERYRLPSESEWEYAARAGTTTPFHTGETITTEQANYDGREYDPSSLYRRQTVPVGSFDANAFGLHDVHGNVWEWVQDCWNDGRYGYWEAPADGSAWLIGDCGTRVLRGGSWNDVPSDLRAANRDGNSAGARNDDVGFRVARTLTP